MSSANETLERPALPDAAVSRLRSILGEDGVVVDPAGIDEFRDPYWIPGDHTFAASAVVQPTTVVVSLGTNDGSSPVRFKDRINRMLSAIGSKRCVVWTNIYRPARKGPYAPLNSVLNAEASKLSRFHLVDWLSAVNSRAVSLPDGLHPNTKGFEYRSQLIADAVKDDCGVGSIGSETAQSDATGGVASPA